METVFKRLVSFLLAAAMLVGAIPFAFADTNAETDTSSTTPVDDANSDSDYGIATIAQNPLPSSMQDNSALRALAYTGYNVSRQKSANQLYKAEYISSALKSTRPSDLSNIPYWSSGRCPNGDETNSSGKPDISRFEQEGLVCASYITYYLCNYLPNVEGVDTSAIYTEVKKNGADSSGNGAYYLTNVGVWQTTLDALAARSGSGVTKYTDATSGYANLVPGDIIIFSQGKHMAIYLGAYDLYNDGSDMSYGVYHFITHVSSRGPEISTVEYVKDDPRPDKASVPVAWYHLNFSTTPGPSGPTEPTPEETEGYLAIRKQTSDGQNLSGWQFGVYYDASCTRPIPGSPFTTSTSGSIVIGPIQEEFTQRFLYVREEGNVNGTISAMYNVASQNPQRVIVTPGTIYEATLVTFTNTLKPGNIQIVKTTSTGADLDGWQIGIYTDAGCQSPVAGSPFVTGADGSITTGDLTVGTYYAKELGRSGQDTSYWTMDTSVKTVEVKAGQTASVQFSNTHLGKVELVKTTNTGDNLDGWQIGLYEDSACTSPVSGSPFTTDASGRVTTGNLQPGTYYAKELGRTTDTGYWTLDPAVKTVTVVAGQTASVQFGNVHNGRIKLIKTIEAGGPQTVQGWQFTITDASGKTYGPYTSAADGTITTENLVPGVYTVTEQIPADSVYYCEQNSQQVTVEPGVTASVTFSNKLKRGNLTVTKTSEDGLVEGVRFHLTGTADCGQKIDLYANTDSSGVAKFENVLIGSNYTLEEVGTGIQYVVPAPQNVNVNWNDVTNASINNALKKWRVELTKKDRKTGYAQGDSSLAGAQYAVYKDGVLYTDDSHPYGYIYTTDTDGKATTDYFVCGDGWSIREYAAPHGYLVDETDYPVGAAAGNFTLELNTLSMQVTEQAIMGRIALLKHMDRNNASSVDTPETDAEFQVYLKSAGSYEDAKPAERDILKTDEHGYAESKDLPYGVYTVHQTKGHPGVETLPDLDIFVDVHGKVYFYSANDIPFYSHIRILKVDKETGKQIPYEGAAFQIYYPNNPDQNLLFTGGLVTMTINYPSVQKIDTFYTNAEGYLVTPEDLPYGFGYKLVEVQAPYGYVLDSNPIYFDITYDTAHEEDGLVIVEVRREDVAQKGIIKVTKTGEVFASVQQDGDVYKPVYEVQGLPGAVYKVVSLEDVYTPDGTLRYRAGDTVSVITTGEDGTGQSEALYLGKYEVQEVAAPDGMVLNTEKKTVELTYNGQEVEITETAVSYRNERQKAALSLTKTMEQDKNFGIGMNGEIQKVRFGLYAAAPLVATDGTSIPADGLLEVAGVDEDGKLAFQADIPFGSYYVKEIATADGYRLSDEKYPVIFSYAGQEVATVQISVNGEEPIVNDIAYGRVEGIKKDRESGEALPGVLLGLFKPDETEFTAEKALLTVTTGPDGSFAFENVPYGSWIIVELKAAEGYLLGEETYLVEISAEAPTVEIEVYNDKTPEMKTTATSEGEKDVTAQDKVTIDDVVHFEHLIPGKEYVVKGTLMDKATGKPFLADGKEVTAEAVFTPEAPSGDVTVSFTFSAKGLTTDTSIVVFESLYKDGVELAVHADIEDEDQTVEVHKPEIHTTATGEDGSKTLTPDQEVTLVDTVYFKGLVPGKEYVLHGTLMDKTTGEPLLVDGKEVTATEVFTPTESSGTVQVTFVFNASALVGKELVVFERLYRADVEIAVHTDINDKDQTVEFIEPEIHTTATSQDGEKTLKPGQRVTIVDTVAYQGLTPGKEYVLRGVLMDKSTGEPLLVGGKNVTAEKTFTPTEANGTVTVTFTFDASELAGKELVVFERLYRDDVEIAVHTDINDKDQTVDFPEPEIHTTAAAENGDKAVDPLESVTIVDTVTYKNLTPGKTYVMKGTLMDKATGQPLLVGGKEVTAETTFIPDAPDGSVEVRFTFDASDLIGKELVVFEDLFRDGVEVTTHADLTDQDQTVNVKNPKLKTTATADGKKTIDPKGKVTITDVVEYSGLKPGKEYVLEGVLMNKATGKPLLVGGKEITAKLTFIPSASSGTQEMTFTFDATGVNAEVVVFERLYRNGALFATHTDINDKDQSVTIGTPPAKTGDTIPLGLLLTLMTASALGIMILAVDYSRSRRRRGRYERPDTTKRQ